MSESTETTAADRPRRTALSRTASSARSAGVAAMGTGEKRQADIRTDGTTEALTRRSRGQRMTGTFDIPMKWRKTGWDYEFKAISILGQPVDGSAMVEVSEAGWRPVPASEMPGMLPPDSEGVKYIDRHGQRLYKRPMNLTLEARREDLEAANEQKRERMRAAQSEAFAGVKGVRPAERAMQLSIEDEYGYAIATEE